MKFVRSVQGLLLSIAVVAAATAAAQVNFSIRVGPPPPMEETVPMLQQGYVWAPGYWAWNHDRHIWVRGRAMLQRTGYRWQPDRWEQRGDSYYRQPGNWAHSGQVQSPRVEQFHPPQKRQQPRNKPHPGNRWPEDQDNGRR